MRCFITCVLVTIAQLSLASSSVQVRPQDIHLAIKQHGAKAVVMELWDDRNKWTELLKSVTTGKKEWLLVAMELSKGTDAGATSMLQIAVTRALGNNPLDTLRIMSDDTVNYSPVFSATFVCSSNFLIDYEANQSSLDFIDTTVEKLKAIKDPALVKTRDECITAFQQARLDTLRIMSEQK